MPQEPKETLIDTIRHLKERDPFEPFQIVMTSGDRYPIERGKNLVLMESQLFYAFPSSNQFVFMRLNQISAVEHLEKRPAA